MNIEKEARKLTAEFLGCTVKDVDDDEFQPVLAFAARVRAAVLTEEDRRVWCERYAHYTANSGMGSSGAVEYANAELNRYREARAVWDARGEKE
mgnify:CR=1 FL=1|jgi:hypothetical protein